MSWKIAPIGRDGDLLYSQAGTPSLDLRFAEKKTLTDYVSGDNLVTFNRSSSGTYVGSDGLIKTTPVNLLTYSEDLDNAAWNKYDGSVSANVDTSPIGDQTADKWIPNTTNNFHFLKAPSTGGSTEVFTYSIYAKQSGYRYLLVNTPNGSSAGNAGPVVDLQDGVVADNYTATYPTSVTNAGNGWWRIVFTFTGSGAIIAIDHNPFPTSTVATYAGDGTSGILLWGAQLEEGITATDYIPTTSSPGGAPRFDHDPTTGESLGLLVEESRTNLLTYSEEFDQWNQYNGSSVSPNAGTAPDGTFNADKAVFDGTAGGQITRDASGLTVGLTYIASMYVKSSASAAAFALGVFGTGSTSYTTTDEWQRVTHTFISAATVRPFQILCNTSDEFLVWGAQVELGSFPTSYIPTSGATATRAADVAEITGANFSSWYNQSEGTAFTDFASLPGNTGLNQVVNFNDTTPSNRINITNRSNGTYQIEIITNNVGQFRADYPFASTRKVAVGYSTNNVNHSYDGQLGTLDTNASLPVVNQVDIGFLNNYMNGHISRLTYWPQRLADTTLQTITT